MRSVPINGLSRSLEESEEREDHFGLSLTGAQENRRFSLEEQNNS
jgi:hypothetical protein